MKAISTSNIEAQKKSFELDSGLLIQILAASILVAMICTLLYQGQYLWSIGIILMSIVTQSIYRLYTEFTNFDWSIDISDFTLDDVMADLEGDS